MATAGWRASDFKGLTPAVDPRRSDDFFALNGRNYLWDVIGPKSAFGNLFVTPYPVGRPQHSQGFRLRLQSGDRVFSMFGDGIFEWDEGIGGWRILYITPDTTISPYRWTYGYLNGYVYFCHPRAGFLAYNLNSGIILPVTSPGAPQQAIAMVINNGRVCVINDTILAWSGPSNGLDWVPRLGGPGFQVIGDRVAGDPIMITSYTAGTLVWTTGGVLRSEFTGDVEVYRHRPLNTEYRPINSFCTMKVDDNTVVIVDERGLFQSKGEAPQPFAPLFNEFLIQFFQDYDLNLYSNVRIEWDDLRKQAYLSTSLSYTNPLYENCFVYYPPVDKWGLFSEPHYGIMPIKIKTSLRADDYFGFVDSSGRLRYWDSVGSREVLPSDTTLNSIYPLIQKPAHNPDGEIGVVLSSSFVVNSVPELPAPKPAGYFPQDGDSPVVPEVTDLDAKIQLGLLRFNGDEAADQMTEVIQLVVANLQSGESDRVRVDYNLIPAGVSDEDYNAETGQESFGLEEINYTNHKIRIISTVDGVSEFQSHIPELETFRKGIRYFSCTTVGIWHILELEANEIGEAFHLRAFELTAIDAGRFS